MRITKNNIKDIYRSTKKNEDVIQSQGYELVKDLFCDNSGMGASDEPALTTSQLEKEIKNLLEIEPVLYCWITGVGQFQVYISVYRKTGKKTSKKIANNTYLLEGKKIMLHDTVILEQKGKYIILNTGGFPTRTTHRRMNEYLPHGVWVYGKDFESYISINGEDKKLVDGMKIEGQLDL